MALYSEIYQSCRNLILLNYLMYLYTVTSSTCQQEKYLYVLQNHFIFFAKLFGLCRTGISFC